MYFEDYNLSLTQRLGKRGRFETGSCKCPKNLIEKILKNRATF